MNSIHTIHVTRAPWYAVFQVPLDLVEDVGRVYRTLLESPEAADFCRAHPNYKAKFFVELDSDLKNITCYSFRVEDGEGEDYSYHAQHLTPEDFARMAEEAKVKSQGQSEVPSE